MKKLIGLGLLLVACRGSMTPTPTPAPGAPGAASAKEAVTAFLAAAKAEDLQAMSAVWGTSTGLARDQMSRTELEQREIYIIRCLRHDKYTVVSDASGPAGSRVLSIQLTRGALTRQADFSAVQGGKGRWFFEKTDLNKLSDMCTAR